MCPAGLVFEPLSAVSNTFARINVVGTELTVLVYIKSLKSLSCCCER